MTDVAALFRSIRVGDLDLPNRIIMASMTRSRADDAGVPTDLMPLYYSQRANAGLIIAEGSQVSTQGVGYIRTPGIHAAKQVDGWRKVTDAVHTAGGRIFLQLWHVGRASHPDFHSGALPVAPSAIGVDGTVFTPSGMKPIPVPRALETEEIPAVIKQFGDAAANAKAAGFDGIEIQGGNGYLLDQFVRDGSNHRTDRYGGSLANRVRFPLEVVEAVTEHWPTCRVGYKISPWTKMLSSYDSDPGQTFSYLAEALGRIGIAFLDVVERDSERPAGLAQLAPELRQRFGGPLILGGGLDAQSGAAALQAGSADLVAFGLHYVANPDLPERFRRAAALSEPDRASLYAGGEAGYTNYPALGG